MAEVGTKPNDNISTLYANLDIIGWLIRQEVNGLVYKKEIR